MEYVAQGTRQMGKKYWHGAKRENREKWKGKIERRAENS